MDNLMSILFICVAFPLLLSLVIIDKRQRAIVIFMIIGLFNCFFVSGVNGIIAQYSDDSLFYITTTYTPISEEIVKAIPIILYGFLFNSKRDRLISIGIAEGIGFAILENAFILVSNVESVSISWSLLRVVGASLVHGLSGAAVAFGVSYVRIRKKFFIPGTFALLICSIIYHGIFNLLVQSQYPIFAYLFTLLTYIPIGIIAIKKRRINKEASKA